MSISLEADSDMIQSKIKKRIMDIIYERLGPEYSPENKYIIAIQGASSSGKTTFSRNLYQSLVDNGISSMLVELDSFYKTPENPFQEVDTYDFDNPVSLDWESIYKYIGAIRDNKENIPCYVRRKNTEDDTKMEYVSNTCPSVLIIEGIYAFNLVNKSKFNLSEYEAENTFKPIRNEYTKNDFDLRGFKVLKILLPLCKRKFKEIRLARDLFLGKPYVSVVSRFENMIWPDTQRWVYSSIEANDIQIIHGNFNNDKVNLTISSLLYFFLGLEVSFEDKLDKDYRNEFNIKCSQECNVLRNSYLVLKDEN